MKNSTLHQFEIQDQAINEFKKYCEHSNQKKEGGSDNGDSDSVSNKDA